MKYFKRAIVNKPVVIRLSYGDNEVNYYRLDQNFSVYTNLSIFGWEISFFNKGEDIYVVSVDVEIPNVDLAGGAERLDDNYKSKMRREFDSILFTSLESYFHNEANVIDLDVLMERMECWLNRNPPQVTKASPGCKF